MNEFLLVTWVMCFVSCIKLPKFLKKTIDEKYKKAKQKSKYYFDQVSFAFPHDWKRLIGNDGFKTWVMCFLAYMKFPKFGKANPWEVQCYQEESQMFAHTIQPEDRKKVKYFWRRLIDGWLTKRALCQVIIWFQDILGIAE